MGRKFPKRKPFVDYVIQRYGGDVKRVEDEWYCLIRKLLSSDGIDGDLAWAECKGIEFAAKELAVPRDLVPDCP